MNINRYILFITKIIAVLSLLVGCTNQPDAMDGKDQELDYSKQGEIIMKDIRQDETNGVQTRAANVGEAMAVGSTFRLYAFKKGETQMDKLIATRTYTIKTTAGVPEMDADQERLYLPTGEIDIYLVGPTEIAADYGVSPMYGYDLISSLTTLDVGPGINEFPPTPLRHRMAKVEVDVFPDPKGSYTKLEVQSILLMNQVYFSEFEFNSNGGEVVLAEDGTSDLTPEVSRVETPSAPKGYYYKATAYVIPRKPAQMRLGVYFTCENTENKKVERRLNSGILENQKLDPGTLTTFTSTPKLSSELLFRIRVMPWDDVTLPDAELPVGEGQPLFSFSGADAPVSIGGKRYWPDRSGLGNHAELVGDIRYNAAGKYYYAATEDAYIKLSDMGNVPIYTLEATLQSKRNAKNTFASFRSMEPEEQSLSINLPMDDNKVILDCGPSVTEAPGGHRVSQIFSAPDLAYMENLTTWAFRVEAKNRASIVRNGIERKAVSLPTLAAHNKFTDNRIMEWRYLENDPGLKLYSLRMTEAYLSDADLRQNYRNDQATFAGLDVSGDFNTQDYIKSGQILNLRGDKMSATVGGKTVWPDESPAKNNAVFVGGGPTYSSSNKAYQFNGGSGRYLSLNTLGTPDEYTLEMVLNPGSAGGGTPFSAFSKPGFDADGELRVYWPLNADKKLYIDSPYNTTDGREAIRWSAFHDTFAYPIYSTKNHLSVTRTKGRLVARLNGIVIADVEAQALLREMRYVRLGCNEDGSALFNGNIHAVRFYNRPLTEMELQLNYQVDKRIYSLFN